MIQANGAWILANRIHCFWVLRTLKASTCTRQQMNTLLDSPLLVFGVALVTLWISSRVGSLFRKHLRPVKEEERHDLDTVLAATLTLLGLLIGFSFSMAIHRYDQRKDCEATEANAIGTEYVRMDLLPSADGARVRELLRNYLQQRILFYRARDDRQLRQVDASSNRLESDLWSAIGAVAVRLPTVPVALTVSGMNDVLNSQAYTQAAWWNRLPVAAWGLMAAISVFCNFVIGYSVYRVRNTLFLVLPLAVSISFLLIADIDSPRHGFIAILPQDLVSLSQSMHAR